MGIWIFLAAFLGSMLLLARRGTTRVRRYDDGVRRSPIGGRLKF